MSPLQYDSGMKSLVHIDLRAGQGGCMEFKVQRFKPGEVRVEPKSEEEASSEGLLRHRKGEESVEDVPMGRSHEVYEVKDPIKWFGILVPQNLRRAQQYFIQGILDQMQGDFTITFCPTPSNSS